VDGQRKSLKPEEKKSRPSICRSLRSIDIGLGCIHRFDDPGNLWKRVGGKSSKPKVRKRRRAIDMVEEQESSDPPFLTFVTF
jgi:hypothetical protein